MENSLVLISTIVLFSAKWLGNLRLCTYWRDSEVASLCCSLFFSMLHADWRRATAPALALKLLSQGLRCSWLFEWERRHLALLDGWRGSWSTQLRCFERMLIPFPSSFNWELPSKCRVATFIYTSTMPPTRFYIHLYCTQSCAPYAMSICNGKLYHSASSTPTSDSSTKTLPGGGKCENRSTPIPITATAALQKNVKYELPVSARTLKMNPNKPCVASRATFSTSVMALSASARCDDGHISVMTPFAAGAEPEPNGNRKAAVSR